jgi:hypothetical protein
LGRYDDPAFNSDSYRSVNVCCSMLGRSTMRPAI